MDETLSNVSNEAPEVVAPDAAEQPSTAPESVDSGAAPTTGNVKSNQKLEADAAAAAARRLALAEVEAEMEALKREKEASDSVIKVLAERDGFTGDLSEYRQELQHRIEEARIAEEAEKVTQKTDPMELAKQLLKEQREKQTAVSKLSTYEQREAEGRRYTNSLIEFRERYPDQQVTDEMAQYFSKGYSLVDAYRLCDYDRQEKEKKENEKVQASNEANAAADVGSLSGQQAAEAELTEEDIDRLSPAELAKPGLFERAMKVLRKKG